MIRTFLIFVFIFVGISVSFSQTKIGIAIPLMRNSENPVDKKLGEQMLKGINDALEEYNSAGPEIKIELKLEDTKKDPNTALQVINKLGSDTNVIAIFGPVFSSELANNAGAAAFHKIPLITPTATQNFIAERNEYVFQLNPTYDVRGRLIARYAMDELGMKSFAILSEDSYGKNLAESFSDEVIKSGKSISVIKYYSKDKADLTEELEELKNNIFNKDKFLDFGNMKSDEIAKLKKVSFKFSYVDSLVNEKLVVSIFKLFGNRAARIIDSLGIQTASKITGNRSLIPGLTDAVYIPVSSSTELSNIIPRFYSENLNLPVLGTGEWNNAKTLIENRMYIKQLYFDSDFFINEVSGKDFTNLDEADIKNYYFGYDGIKLILSRISEGNTTRKELNDALGNVNDHKSTHNNITIKNRTNHLMSIMSFSNGKLKKVKDFVY